MVLCKGGELMRKPRYLVLYKDENKFNLYIKRLMNYQIFDKKSSPSRQEVDYIGESYDLLCFKCSKLNEGRFHGRKADGIYLDCLLEKEDNIETIVNDVLEPNVQTPLLFGGRGFIINF
jgi:hypothetical protein